ncbi:MULTISPECIES: iron-containing alcohol dehydrogenase [unclassified Acidovorax]|uniref:iron-containing alcohol dehydrogenase n=1 Tax=unclassified Acidovorax TaxID=2684926 RepID=UPI00288336DD|nr:MULTISPECIES: iron-containing alcohol dehydrogenase [unclassified Acidovorax]
MNDFVFETPPRIVSRPGAALDLAAELAPLGVRHVFVVTDPGLMRAGVVQPPVDALRASGLQVTVFAEIQAELPEANVLAAGAIARAAGVDAVIGLGGGSALDAAKLVALLAVSQQPIAEMYGVGLATGRRLALVQVPTTAGTGSEATPVAVVARPDHIKRGVVCRQMLPDVAVLDGALTTGLPPAITAMTGIDAIVHAVEAFSSRRRKNVLSDALAVQALQLLYAHLPRVVQQGDDVAARTAMLQGSLFAGMAFANASVGAVHALSSPLGGHFQVPHGLSNALIFCAVLRFNLPETQVAYATLGRALRPELQHANHEQAASGFVQAMQDLVRTLPIAQSLRDVGVQAGDLPRLAQDGMSFSHMLDNNPRVVRQEDALAILAEAL